MYYILDHYYAEDHLDFCRVIRSDIGASDMAELLMTIQFYFEDCMEETVCPALDDVITLLAKWYEFGPVNKYPLIDTLESILDSEKELDYASYETWEDEGYTYTYLDLYEIRESLRGPGRPYRLYDKWLTPDVMDDIGKLRVCE